MGGKGSGKIINCSKDCIASTKLMIIFNSNHTHRAGKVHLSTHHSDCVSRVGERSFIQVMSPSTVINTYLESSSDPCGSVCACACVCQDHDPKVGSVSCLYMYHSSVIHC